MKPTLVVMAAGMGSRYGGLKQVDPVGPGGETIIDYSIYDALRAGFERVVFIIRHDIETEFKQKIGAKFARQIPVAYVFQELTVIPTGFSVPANRTKPWGTGQAILMTEPSVDGPFGVINADDFYGRESFQVLAAHLQAAEARSPLGYAMVGYTLRKTLSDHGSVSRGVCELDSSGFLHQIRELTKIERAGAEARYTDEHGAPHTLHGDTVVSMNMWGFTPALFPQLRELFADFLHHNGQSEKSEFYIPLSVGTLINQGRARVKVLPTAATWFGITYREDKPIVMDSIRQLTAQGEYPERLWS